MLQIYALSNADPEPDSIEVDECDRESSFEPETVLMYLTVLPRLV